MLYRLLFVASSIFWLVMTALLVDREILFSPSGPDVGKGYEQLLRGLEGPRSTRMAILVFDPGRKDLVRIGTTESETRPEPDGTYRITGRTRIDFGDAGGALAQIGRVQESEIEMVVGPDFRLQTLRVRIEMLGQSILQEGRVEGDLLHLTTAANGAVREETIDARDHPLLADEYGAFEMPRDLAVGRSWETVRVHPLTKQRTHYEAEVVRLEENFYWEGKREQVFVVVMSDDQRTMEVTSFVTPDGRILEQHLPFRVILRLEKAGS